MCANNYSLTHLIIFLIDVKVKSLQMENVFYVAQKEIIYSVHIISVTWASSWCSPIF